MSSLLATGYVHSMLDEDQDFPTFAMHCARQFSPLLSRWDMQRENEPMPEAFEPDAFIAVELAKAEAELARLSAMDEVAQIEYGEQRKVAQIDSMLESASREAAEVARVRRMICMVTAWNAPSPDHDGLKEFMLRQLNNSIPGATGTYFESQLSMIRRETSCERFKRELAIAARKVERYKGLVASEENRVALGNRWIKSLRDSLK